MVAFAYGCAFLWDKLVGLLRLFYLFLWAIIGVGLSIGTGRFTIVFWHLAASALCSCFCSLAAQARCPLSSDPRCLSLCWTAIKQTILCLGLPRNCRGLVWLWREPTDVCIHFVSFFGWNYILFLIVWVNRSEAFYDTASSRHLLLFDFLIRVTTPLIVNFSLGLLSYFHELKLLLQALTLLIIILITLDLDVLHALQTKLVALPLFDIFNQFLFSCFTVHAAHVFLQEFEIGLHFRLLILYRLDNVLHFEQLNLISTLCLLYPLFSFQFLDHCSLSDSLLLSYFLAKGCWMIQGSRSSRGVIAAAAIRFN